MSLVCRLSVAAVLVAKSFDAVVVCDELDCSAACWANAFVLLTADCCCAPIEELVAYAFVVEVAACCWAPTEEPVWNALLVAVEAPKLEPCDAFVE